MSGIFFDKGEKNGMNTIKWKIIFTVYILFLLATLSLLGGQSTSGVSLDNGVFWIVLLISIYQIYSQWKDVKKSESI